MQTASLPRKAGKREAVGSPILREALRYAAKDWRVIPLHSPTPNGCSCRKHGCESVGKHPRTKTGLKEATCDEEKIRAWWSKWPDANIGIATGPESDLCILDVDGEDGQASLRALEAVERLPATLRALTGRKGADGKRSGAHIYFRHAGANLPNSAGRLGKGLDIRGAGGYVVAPPSLHASGLTYEWDGELEAIAGLPAWLIVKASKPAIEVVRRSESSIPEGQRNSTLLSIAGTMRRKGMAASSIDAALKEENRERCNPPLSDGEVASIAARAGRYPPGKESKTRRADVLCLADVKAEKVDWLWEPYVPLKMITILSGDPGVGKTFLALDLAASLTRGESILEGASMSPSNVLYLTQENSPAHVLRPRFDALGGDANRFFILRGTLCDDGTSGHVTLGDAEQLEEAITRCNARLVVIDPLQSFLGGSVDAHRANETRPIMDGLIRLAESTECAILITRHLSKGIGGSALYRGMGSIDITGAARSELLVAREPNHEGRIVMAHSKSNLGTFGPSLSFSIDDSGKVIWHGESTFKANDLLSAPPSAEERGALDEAVDFLRETLADGPRPVREVQSRAEDNGISKMTLRRARTSIGVEKKPDGFGKGWTLSLPSIAQEPPQLLIPTP